LYHSIIILQYYRVIDNDNSSRCHSIIRCIDNCRLAIRI